MMNVAGTLKEQQGMRNAVDNILERHRMFTHRWKLAIQDMDGKSL